MKASISSMLTSFFIWCKVRQGMVFNECVVTVWKATDRQKDRQTDGQTNRHT